MAQMKYKTKNNSDPKGKPKVYFTCHPADYERFFKKVWEDISATHDVALYYTADMTEAFSDDHLETDLGQMNLFVVPVTKQLLSEPNRAMDVDIAYAQEENIPILPFMMEPELNDLYSQPDKFGNRQYLEPYSEDTTAIQYPKKLKKYLESVLISDKMAKRVQAAFDAYIFLSYRKKDRRYAHELMKLIHNDPECWDIAIWYDEFLTPGESFLEGIQKALEDSKLFTLLVTPNLLEEPDGKPNFVMGEEYPAAVKAKKPILPAELVPTDHDALAEKYRDLPECIDPHDDAALKELLLQAIHKVAITANNRDPEHNFLIGLAYLDGIDVEVNRERALELITSSANGELIEAMDKLAQMYHDGNGVTMSRDISLQWRKKKIALLQRKYDESPDNDKLLSLIAAVDAYTLACLNLGKVSDTRQCCEQMERLIDLACQKPEHATILQSLAFKYVGLGLHYTATELPDMHIAELRNLEKAYKILEKQAIAAGTTNAWELVAVMCSHICRNRECAGDFAGARSYYEKMISIDEEQHRKEGTINRFPYTFEQLSEICQKCGDLHSAKVYLEKSLAIRELLAEEANTVETWINLSCGYKKLVELCRSCADDSGVQVYTEKSLAAAEMPIGQAVTIDQRRATASAFEKLNYHNDAGNLAYEKAVAMREALAQETGALEDWRALLDCYAMRRHPWPQDLAADLLFAEKELAVREALAQKTANGDDYRDLSACYLKLSEIYKSSGDYPLARGCLEKKLALDQRLVQHSQSSIDQHMIADDYFHIGDLLCAEQSDIAEAQAYFDKAIAIGIAVAQATQDAKDRHTLAMYYKQVGTSYKDTGNLTETRKFYELSLAIQESLEHEKAPAMVRSLPFGGFFSSFSRVPQDEYYTVPVDTYEDLGRICVRCGDLPAAIDHFEKALVMHERSASRSGHVNDQRTLAYQYSLLRRLCNKQGDYAGAKRHCQKELEVAERLVCQTGLAEDRRRLMSGHGGMGDVCMSTGDTSSAKQHFALAFDISVKNIQEAETLDNFDDLAFYHYKLATVHKGEERAEHRREAIQIYQMLCEKKPEDERYPMMLDHVKSELPS